MTEPIGVPRRPTMVDVARLAGVSHQTVSRYLRFNGGLRESTLKRIDAAIEELDYRPNLVARSMRTRRSGIVSILIPAQLNTYSPHLIAGAAAVAHEAGLQVEVTSVEGGPIARARRLLELADAGMFEGILSLTPIPQASLDRLHPSGAAVVVSGYYDDLMRGIGELADGSAMGEMVEHLVSLGHRGFLHVAGPDDHPSAHGRKIAYLDAVQRLKVRSFGVCEGDWSAESGINAVMGLPDGSGVTAVLCANDEVAAGVIRGAFNRGWSIPDDLSVTGWDNNPLGAYLPPTLTSVDVDYMSLGRQAMRRLIAAIRGQVSRKDEPAKVYRVVWRESTDAAYTAPPRLASPGQAMRNRY